LCDEALADIAARRERQAVEGRLFRDPTWSGVGLATMVGDANPKFARARAACEKYMLAELAACPRVFDVGAALASVAYAGRVTHALCLVVDPDSEIQWAALRDVTDKVDDDTWKMPSRGLTFCRHNPATCTHLRGVARGVMVAFAAQIFKECDWDVFQRSDTILVSTPLFDGDCGAFGDELDWKRVGTDVDIKPVGGGKVMRVRDVQPLLESGFQLANGKSFQSSKELERGPFVVYRLIVCESVWGSLPRWDFRSPVSDVGSGLADKSQQDLVQVANQTIGGLSIGGTGPVVATAVADAVRAVVRTCKVPYRTAVATVVTSAGEYRAAQLASADFAIRDLPVRRAWHRKFEVQPWLRWYRATYFVLSLAFLVWSWLHNRHGLFFMSMPFCVSVCVLLEGCALAFAPRHVSHLTPNFFRPA